MSQALKSFNPFHEGPAGKYFVGRTKTINRFELALNALDEQESAHMFIAGVNGCGKTSCLEKLVEMATARGWLAVRVPLDGRVRALQQVITMVKKLVERIDEKLADIHLAFRRKPRPSGRGGIRLPA